MPKLSDIESTPLSPLYHVNALLDSGPDWNYLMPSNNTILYTFSVASGNEVRNGTPISGQSSFSISQQVNARSAIDYISKLTGIVFVETSDGASAHVHLANMDIADANTVGLCSWRVSYGASSVTGELTSYEADAWVYLDNREWASHNANLAPGGSGYETLLHELGHMLGLKHPHEDDIQLSPSQDNTSQTIMSYDHLGGPYAQFNSLDIAALDWLYGRDGLGGNLGINSVTGARYLSGSRLSETIDGTPFDDTLRGDKGNDTINGGAGTDTAVFSGNRDGYVFNVMAGDTLIVSGADGTDTLTSVELFQFADGVFLRGQVIDTTPPVAPLVNVAKNANGYIAGNVPTLFGKTELNSTVTIFAGTTAVGTGKSDENGLFKVTLAGMGNGTYTLSAVATDAAGNRSPASSVTFKVDGTPPVAPTVAFQAAAADGNQPAFSGTGEAGSTIKLFNNGSELIATALVDGTGKWSSANPLANGNYNVSVKSFDAADNNTTAATAFTFVVNSSLNRVGTAANDVITGTSGNNALQGMAGIDTALYTGARAGYAIDASANGYIVASAADGRDSLIGVERLKFSDMSVAIDIEGNGGMAYRVYNAIFAREPDLVGLGFWIDHLDDGLTLNYVASRFLASEEFFDRFGANLSTQDYVEKLYLNVLNRPLDQDGFNFWVAALDRGVPREDILIEFSESIENKAQVIGAIEHGIEYVPWLG
ncbi:DUF4214 domain-containing protein [Massilia soli]|uniref:DUF4214 domain-containing protein n=1 Tax=Massilia soli TaxID=2792854 RepID=A0ABS7SJM8_9BURK|nr:DUF4214 domain-containing protein [Massilia soli]MBZ2206410.1 DUF4214 domain-containing protein [Massilia soli]